MRDADYDATHMVKATKGLPLHQNAYSVMKIGGRRRRVTESNKLLAVDWFAEWAAPLVDEFGEQTKVLVPIPASDATRSHDGSFRTAVIANAITAQCTTHVVVSTALRWKKPKPKSGGAGTRQAPVLFQNLHIPPRDLPVGDIVLIDDVFTSGGHLRAATWKISDLGRTVIGAICCGKTCHAQLPDPFDVGGVPLDVTRPAGV